MVSGGFRRSCMSQCTHSPAGLLTRSGPGVWHTMRWAEADVHGWGRVGGIHEHMQQAPT